MNPHKGGNGCICSVCNLSQVGARPSQPIRKKQRLTKRVLADPKGWLEGRNTFYNGNICTVEGWMNKTMDFQVSS